MRILIHNSKLPNNNFHLPISIWRACSELSGVEAKLVNSYSIPLAIKEFKPHLVLTIGGELIPERIFEYMQRQDLKWVLWTTEDPFELAYHQAISKHFDYVFTSDKASRELYRHPHCFYLPLAADKRLFYRPVIEDPHRLLYDLIFIGTAWPNRILFLKELISKAKQKNLKSRFVLPTNPFIPLDVTQETGLNKFEHNFRISVGDMATLQNYSLFTLTLLRDFSADGKSRPQTSPTNRFYETSLAGTGQIFVSSEASIVSFYPELENSINQCQTVDEVLEKVLTAKADPESRNRGALTVQDFVLQKHSYVNRIQEMLGIVSMNTASVRE